MDAINDTVVLFLTFSCRKKWGGKYLERDRMKVVPFSSVRIRSPHASPMDFCGFGLLKRGLCIRPPTTIGGLYGKFAIRYGMLFPLNNCVVAFYNGNYDAGPLLKDRAPIWSIIKGGGAEFCYVNNKTFQ